MGIDSLRRDCVFQRTDTAVLTKLTDSAVELADHHSCVYYRTPRQRRGKEHKKCRITIRHFSLGSKILFDDADEIGYSAVPAVTADCTSPMRPDLIRRAGQRCANPRPPAFPVCNNPRLRRCCRPAHPDFLHIHGSWSPLFAPLGKLRGSLSALKTVSKGTVVQLVYICLHLL